MLNNLVEKNDTFIHYMKSMKLIISYNFNIRSAQNEGIKWRSLLLLHIQLRPSK